MEKVGTRKIEQERHVRIENVNDVFLYFSLIQYSASAFGLFIKYFFIQGNLWDFILLCGLILAMIGQVVLYRYWENSYCYGCFTMLLAAMFFTMSNIMFDGSIILIALLPTILLCILYMSERFLYAMYGVWSVNALICLVKLMSREMVYSKEWRDFFITVGAFVLFSISSYMVNNSMALQYANICRDLKRENRRNQKFYQESIADSTTGLLNRNAYNEYLSEFDGGKLESMCCIFVDVNGLHEYNNTYGHYAGDKMLKRVAISIKECFSSDKCYRVGGDEFVILSENKNFKMMLEELQNFRAQMESRRIHIAYGMEWRDENLNIKEMVKNADLKMYQNKERFYRMNPVNRDRKSLYKKAVE